MTMVFWFDHRRFHAASCSEWHFFFIVSNLIQTTNERKNLFEKLHYYKSIQRNGGFNHKRFIVV